MAILLTVLTSGMARAQQPQTEQAADIVSNAQNHPLIRFGLEWGYTPTIAGLYHYNYISDDGYRINDSGSGLYYATNADILAHFGVNVSRKLSISAITGNMGITKGTRVIPIIMRLSYYFNGVSNDGMFTYVDGGAGIHPAKPETPPRNAAWLANLGGGYRIALSREISLDFLSSVRWTYDHALIQNPDTGGWVQPQNIRRDNTGYLALTLSIGLTF